METRYKDFEIFKNNLSSLKKTSEDISDGTRYMTQSEVKNGKVDKNEVYKIHYKIYDSLLFFNDIIGENITFCRGHLSFILVYNEDKNPGEDSTVSPDLSSKVAIANRLSQKGGKRFIRFGLERFEKLYFHKIDTYTIKEFETEFLPKTMHF